MVLTWSKHGPNMNQKLLKMTKKHCFSFMISLVLVRVHILNALDKTDPTVPYTPKMESKCLRRGGLTHKHTLLVYIHR